MANLYTRRTVLLRGASGIAVASGIVGCAGQRMTSAPAATQPVVDTLQSDVWTTDLADVVGPAKQGTWLKSATVDDGFCVIKAGMSILFNQDSPGQGQDTFSGSFDIWVATDSDAKPQLHQSFEVFDSAGKSLFKLGPFGGFEMSSPVNYHHWIGYFDYPKDSYGQMARCRRLPSTCRQ